MKTIFTLIYLVFTFQFTQAQIVQERTIQINKDVQLKLVEKKFNPEEHNIQTEDEVVYTIDGHLVFGTDLTMPQTELDQAMLIMGDKTIPLNVKGIYNPEIDLILDSDSYSFNNILELYVLRCLFSVGAGRTAVEWYIYKGKSERTMINSGNIELNDGFIKE